MKPMPKHNEAVGLEGCKVAATPDGSSLLYQNVKHIWGPTLHRLLDHHFNHALVLKWRPAGKEADSTVAARMDLLVAPLDCIAIEERHTTLESWLGHYRLDVVRSAQMPKSTTMMVTVALPDTKANIVLSDVRLWNPACRALSGGVRNKDSAHSVGYLRLMMNTAAPKTSDQNGSADKAGSSAPLRSVEAILFPSPQDREGGPAAKRARRTGMVARPMPQTMAFEYEK